MSRVAFHARYKINLKNKSNLKTKIAVQKGKSNGLVFLNYIITIFIKGKTYLHI